ncbi:serine/threonine protein kinase [Calothrix sp. NIES-2100]|uniref:serine/threonine-protein kinase n=1 Tax=Calothrix sp. NIES-2100 TaxID=1954172 RepID=UPI000B61FBF7|nr:serine/threonine protein kinase [Calothrix sp. NIES-2100]
MLYCSNPNCLNTFSPDGNKFCIQCGQTLALLFRNRFRVIRLLGEGGFGKTYEARDVDRMDEPCVIKQFFPQVQGTAALEKAKELFNQEGKRLYELGEHPQIPRLIAYFEQDKRLYLVQELIDGHNLLQELQQQGTFSEEKIIQLLNDLLPVLKFIHERGVIHRDIKPENIMRRQHDGRLMLIDFGVSKQAIGTIIGQVGTTVGTPGYAPVEQMRGQVFPASDLYSLGVTCIRLLTGCLPNADGYDELYDALHGVWRWRERLQNTINISPNLGQILDKFIQDYVNNRYQSVEDVLQVLNPITLQPDPLPPARKVDYTKLHDLLMKNKWREADQETLAIMLKVSRREKQGWLDVEDIKKFPLEELSTIDDLWNTHSKGKFGFKIQTQIWLSIQGKLQTDYQIWCSFGNRVGWCQRYSWKGYDNLTFSSKSPKGHLPSGIFMLFQGFGNWDLRLSSLAARFMNR